jgi:acetyl-CoA carboxylase biotin carboxyl carrier protein
MKNEVLAHMPGLVARVTCKVGDPIKKGDLVVVLNVMKQEVEVKSGYEGTVKKILVKEWDEMEVNTPMIVLE